MREHPDRGELVKLKYSKCNYPADSYEYRRCVFVNAATWPDFIRDDPRFYDETGPHAKATKQLEGFPDMQVHKPWHYKDLPFTTDNSPVMQPGDVNAQTKIHAFRGAIAAPDVSTPHKAYFMSWLLHMTGDVHQPLHCVSRFTKDLSPPKHPEGDRGGNEFLLKPYPMPESQYPAEKLHSLWDGALGTHTDLASIRKLAAAVTQLQPRPAQLSTDEGVWIGESFKLARDGAYALSPCQGSQGRACVTDAYFKAAELTARRRVALAGYRLADVLNAALK